MSAKEVKIYSTPTCSYCKLAKKFMDDNSIAYLDLDVAEDEKAREDMVSRSGQMGVPVIDVGGVNSPNTPMKNAKKCTTQGFTPT